MDVVPTTIESISIEIESILMMIFWFQDAIVLINFLETIKHIHLMVLCPKSRTELQGRKLDSTVNQIADSSILGLQPWF